MVPVVITDTADMVDTTGADIMIVTEVNEVITTDTDTAIRAG